MSTSTTAALQGTGSESGGSSKNAAVSNTATPLEDFHYTPSQLLSLSLSKHDAVEVLKSDLLDDLNKGVKSLDEDSWMFEGPRSNINLISKRGSSFLSDNCQPSNNRNWHCSNE